MAHVETFEQHGTHRLIPTKYAAESVLESLPLSAQVISDLTELDAATNERKLAERGQNAAIPPGELLYGVPEAHIVNATFTHVAPSGGRFNDGCRGAWYGSIPSQGERCGQRMEDAVPRLLEEGMPWRYPFLL